MSADVRAVILCAPWQVERAFKRRVGFSIEPTWFTIPIRSVDNLRGTNHESRIERQIVEL